MAGPMEEGVGLGRPGRPLLQADAVEVGVGIAALAGQSGLKTAEDEEILLNDIRRRPPWAEGLSAGGGRTFRKKL